MLQNCGETFYQENGNFIKKCLHSDEPYDSIINGSLVKRLRRRPLTAETRVRFPYGLLLLEITAQPGNTFQVWKVFFCFVTIQNPSHTFAKTARLPVCRFFEAFFLLIYGAVTLFAGVLNSYLLKSKECALAHSRAERGRLRLSSSSRECASCRRLFIV